MPQISVTTRALDLTLAKFRRFRPMEAVHKRIADRLERAREKIVRYPAPYRGKMVFVSERQRRYVLAAIRDGRISVPYARTGAYGASYRVTPIRDGYRLASSGVSYAKYVGGDARGASQARIHAGRWALARPVVDAELERLPRAIREEIRVAGRRAGFSL